MGIVFKDYRVKFMLISKSFFLGGAHRPGKSGHSEKESAEPKGKFLILLMVKGNKVGAANHVG